jgi:parallel beta-helix repeat protein
MFRDLLATLFSPSRRTTGTRRTNRFVPRLEGVEDRAVPATFNVAAGGSIQAAINAAAAANDGNDIINVAKATYTGNLVIPNSANLTNLIIQTTGTPTAENSMAVINATSGAVITVDGEANVTIRNLKIDGTGTQANQGVFVEHGASVTIQSDFIRNIAPTNGGEGIAIRVGRFQGTPVTGGTVTVKGNTISGYSDAGVVVTNGSDGTVSGNTVTGLGNTVAAEGNTQNGIEISFGAVGNVTGNTVRRNGFHRSNNASSGILLYKAAFKATYAVSGNTVQNNDFGISVIDGDRPTISGNTATANYAYGIGFDSSDGVAMTVGATVQGNTASNNTSLNIGGTVETADGFFFAFLRGTAAAPISISGNTASNNMADGFDYEMSVDRGNLTFTGNTASSNQDNGVEFRDLQVNLSTTAYGPLTITGNTSSSNSGDGLLIENVQFTGSGSVSASVSGNTLSSNAGNGIRINNSNGVVIDGGQSPNQSTVKSNALNGIVVVNSNNISVQRFTIQLNTLDGIQVQNSGTVSILANTIGGSSTTGNKQNGIEFINAHVGTVMGNTVRFNSFNGILLDANSTNNTIGGTGSGQANTFTNNNQANKPIYFDANDQSGTATTVLNNWVQNTIGTKNKSVIH